MHHRAREVDLTLCLGYGGTSQPHTADEHRRSKRSGNPKSPHTARLTPPTDTLRRVGRKRGGGWLTLESATRPTGHSSSGFVRVTGTVGVTLTSGFMNALYQPHSRYAEEVVEVVCAGEERSVGDVGVHGAVRLVWDVGA